MVGRLLRINRDKPLEELLGIKVISGKKMLIGGENKQHLAGAMQAEGDVGRAKEFLRRPARRLASDEEGGMSKVGIRAKLYRRFAFADRRVVIFGEAEGAAEVDPKRDLVRCEPDGRFER